MAGVAAAAQAGGAAGAGRAHVLLRDGPQGLLLRLPGVRDTERGQGELLCLWGVLLGYWGGSLSYYAFLVYEIQDEGKASPAAGELRLDRFYGADFLRQSKMSRDGLKS